MKKGLKKRFFTILIFSFFILFSFGLVRAEDTGGDWRDVLNLLNEKRSDVGKNPVSVSHPEDISMDGVLTIREGTVDILEDYGFTGLADALNCAGYAQTTWFEGFDCKNEIENILNLMYVTELNGQDHLSEPNLIEQETLCENGYVNYTSWESYIMDLRDCEPYFRATYCEGELVMISNYYTKTTLHFNSLPSNINILDYYMSDSFSCHLWDSRVDPIGVTKEDIISQIPSGLWITGGSCTIYPPSGVFCTCGYYPILKYAYHICNETVPKASFTYSPEKPMVGGNIIFDASSSDGEIAEYEWNFGDGTIVSDNIPDSSHMYEYPAKYSITLTVTDNDGFQSSTSSELDLTLEKGDLLLCRSDMSYVPGKEWTHIGIYLGDNKVVEARLGGVGVYPLSDWFWATSHGKTYVRALRVKTEANIREEAANFAGSKNGQPFDWWSIINQLKQEDGERWYCSELLWAAYLNASNDQINLDQGGQGYWWAGFAVLPDEIDLDDDVEIIGEHKEDKPETVWCGDRIWGGVAYSPVDLEITDPDGFILNKQGGGIPEAIYEELDIDEDGDLDDFFAILEPKVGDYLIGVIPEPDALPEDTYSLEVAANGKTVVLAENIPISEIPEQRYLVRSTLEKIAFASQRDGNGEIYAMNPDGSAQTNLTNNPVEDLDPSLLSDASKIAFESWRDGNSEIYVMNSDGSAQTKLTNNPAEDYDPSFSPDGARIAFTSNRDENWEIYVMDADGSNQINLTNNPAEDRVPSFSSDGSKIAFASNRDGNFEIYVMNADGTQLTNLTNNPETDYYPSFSPDGSKITFASYRDENWEIYMMDADGSNQINLTNNPAHELFPSCFSSDGSRIAFTSDRDENFEIYVMNADGSNQIRLTYNSELDRQPSWGPWALLSPSEPNISVSPTSYGFGSIDIDSSSTQTFAINNTGNADLVIDTISITGENGTEFNIQNDNCSGQTIAPSGTCTVDVVFSPISEGAKIANLSIPSNDPGIPTLNMALSGTGIHQYTLTINIDGTGTGTITSNPAGINCGTDCTETYKEGTGVTLTATSDVGSIFAGWADGGCSGTGTCQVTMNEDTTVTATFTLKTYTITASAGSGGTITPSGAVIVSREADQTFTIMLYAGYHVADVLVDGSSVGAVTTHTFTNVTSDHTIEASFAINEYAITASAGANGSISPAGSVTVNHEADQTFSITPATGYHVADVLVEGSSVGAVTTYTFTSVTADHTIEATFEIDTLSVWTWLGPEGVEVRSLAVSANWPTDQTIVFGSGYMPGRFYRTTDGGTTWWSMQPLGDESYYNHFDAIALSPDYHYGGLDQTVFLGGGNQAWVYLSTDSGDTWYRDTTGISGDKNTWDLAVSSGFATDGTVFVAGNNGVHKSVDGGITFFPVNNGLPGGSHLALAISPNYPNDQTVLVGTYYGVYNSTDGGNSWAPTSNGLPASESSSYPKVYDLVISPNYANDQTIFAGVWTRGIYRSIDGGTNWSLVYPDAYVIGFQSLAISPNYAEDGTLFVGTTFHYGTWRGIVISQDGGDTWSQIENTGFSSLALQSTPDVVLSPDFAVDHTIFRGRRDGVWMTTIMVPDITVTPLSFDFGSVNVGSTSTAQTFTVSNTGGADIVIDTITLTGTDASEFDIQNDNCSGQTVAPSGTCTVDVVFSPTSTGSKSTNLSIPSNDPDTPTLNVPLSGTGVAVALVKGDIDGDGNVDLVDAILAIQIVSGITPTQAVYAGADVNGDGKIGIEEVIYILQKVSGMR